MRTLLSLLAAPALLAAQTPPDAARERADFAQWWQAAPISPYAALGLQPIGPAGVSLGPSGSDVVLEGIGQVRLTDADGVVRLITPGGSRMVPRSRAVPLGPYRFVVAGDAGRATVTVFGSVRDAESPTWYAWDLSAVAVGTITAPPEPMARRLLTMDGVAVDAAEAGTFTGTLRGQPVRLSVHRFADPGTEESELLIYFRDATNGAGTYPAGRWVAAEPLGGGRFRVDFNRARNSFCAYSSVFPCPLPWPGNAVAIPIEAGERYAPHAAAPPAPPAPRR